MERPNLNGMRVRPPTLSQSVTDLSATFRDSNIGTNIVTPMGSVATRRTSIRMYDVSNPNFRKRSAAGEIFNNPMYKYREDLDFPAMEADFSLRDGQFTGHATFRPNAPSSRLTFNTKDYARLQDNAITDAYASISANEGNTLLWIGELKETVAMLFDIGKGVRALMEKTKKQRKQWAKGKLSVEESQGLTLQLLYGILPLEQQIADFLEGLFRIKDSHKRNTARSFRNKVESSDHSESGWYNMPGNPYGSYEYDVHSVESLDVAIRAGVLYDVDTSDFPFLSIILDPKAVISTAYALARLSFVIDWFINVGGTLAAWSPAFGTTVRSAWVTVEVTHTHLAKYVPQASSAYQAEGRYKYETIEKWRVPISRSDLSVFPPIDVNLDLDKILAMVLLFAKVKKTL